MSPGQKWLHASNILHLGAVEQVSEFGEIQKFIGLAEQADESYYKYRVNCTFM